MYGYIEGPIFTTQLTTILYLLNYKEQAKTIFQRMKLVLTNKCICINGKRRAVVAIQG